MAGKTKDTAVVAGTAGTTARVDEWTKSKSHVHVHNTTTVSVYVSFYESVEEYTEVGDPSVTQYDQALEPGDEISGHVSTWGLELVKRIAVWVPTGGTIADVIITANRPED